MRTERHLPDEAPPRTERRRFAIATVLSFGFGGFVFLGMTAILAIGLWSARSNTLSLLADKVELSNQTIVDYVKREFDPVADSGTYLSQLVASGRFDPNDREDLVRYLRGAMAATPQVAGIGFLSTEGDFTRVARDGLSTSGRLDRDAEIYLAEARKSREPYWGQLVWNDETRQTLVNLRTPVYRGDSFLGVIVSAVSVAELSKFLGASSISDSVPYQFILYGRTHVLAHRSMAFGTFERSPQYPIPRLDQILDPVLQYMWREDLRRPLQLTFTGETTGHRIEVDGQSYLFLYRRLDGYGPMPLYVGIYLPPNSGQEAEIQRLATASTVGAVVLILTVLGAVVLGRRISRPIGNLAAAARTIGSLEFQRAETLPRSRLREIDDAATAFNSMTAGLRWFETYVPRKLVKRLFHVRHGADPVSEEQTVTVMFTDIVQFTALAERLSATETAALLNEHFTAIAECIDAEDGTVDKYIGDSVMAFWGPPLGGGDHATRACRAAQRIRAAMGAGNDARRERGLPPIAIRVGIHTGSAIVGNIGAPGRINYTLVGDTVNISQRIEQLAKDIAVPGAHVTIAVSGDVVTALNTAGAAGEFTLTKAGTRDVRGRMARVEMYRLD